MRIAYDAILDRVAWAFVTFHGAESDANPKKVREWRGPMDEDPVVRAWACNMTDADHEATCIRIGEIRDGLEQARRMVER